jgi:hypothetical protein
VNQACEQSWMNFKISNHSGTTEPLFCGNIHKVLIYVLSTNHDTIAESTISLTQRPSLLSFLYNTICSPQRSTLWAFTLVSFARSFNLNRIYKNLKDAAWPSDAKLTIYPVRYIYYPHLCVGLSGPLIVFFTIYTLYIYIWL